MADELRIVARLEVIGDDLLPPFAKSILADQASSGYHLEEAFSCATGGTDLDLGPITTPGYILVVNKDSTNFMEIRDGAGTDSVVEVPAGELALFKLKTTTPRGVADTSAVEIAYLMLEA